MKFLSQKFIPKPRIGIYHQHYYKWKWPPRQLTCHLPPKNISQILGVGQICQGFKVSSDLWGRTNCWWRLPSPNTLYTKFQTHGFIPYPKSTIYMPWVLNKVIASDLSARRFCGHGIYHAQIPLWQMNCFISPEIAIICHGMTSSELWGHWYCAYYICYIHISPAPNFSTLVLLLSPKVEFIWHGYYIKWPSVTSKATGFVVMTYAT